MGSKTKVNTAPAKGTRDFLPAELRRRRYVTDIIREVYEAHGFEPLETPAYERLDTLLGKYGDEGDQLVFKILHRGQALVRGIRAASAYLTDEGAVQVGRSGETAPGAELMLSDLGLRYDLTVPLARVVAEYRGKLPPIFKRYQIQPVWRADSPGKGRFREFFQCDVDIVGATSRLVEAEACSAVATCLHRLGFEGFKIRLNHRALLRALIELCEIPVALEGPAIVAIDKLDKVSPDAVRAELITKGASESSADALLSLVSGETSLDAIAEAFGGHEAGCAAVADLREVLSLAAVTAAGPHLMFDVSLARGLGYYTGSIFEIAVDDLAGSLGGGGRYDDLIGMFGSQSVPACGFSIGLERILVVMEQRSMFPATLAGPRLLLAATHASGLATCLELATSLRQRGLAVDLVPKAMKPGKLRKAADDRGVPFAAWLDDPSASEVTLWSSAQRDQPATSVRLTDLAALLAEA